jgi:hypothetical protein
LESIRFGLHLHLLTSSAHFLPSDRFQHREYLAAGETGIVKWGRKNLGYRGQRRGNGYRLLEEASFWTDARAEDVLEVEERRDEKEIGVRR